MPFQEFDSAKSYQSAREKVAKKPFKRALKSLEV